MSEMVRFQGTMFNSLSEAAGGGGGLSLLLLFVGLSGRLIVM